MKMIHCEMCEFDYRDIDEKQKPVHSCPYCGTVPSTGLPEPKFYSALDIFCITVGIICSIAVIVIIISTFSISTLKAIQHSYTVKQNLKGIIPMIIWSVIFLGLGIKSHLAKRKLYEIAQTDRQQYKQLCMARSRKIDRKF